MQLAPGTLVQDTYEVMKELGRGGMGSTYLARHKEMGHEVAIKLVNPELSPDPRVLELFRREANLMRTVNHDAVVNIETLLKNKDGALFLIMEYVPGRQLSDYLVDGHRLSPGDVMRLGARLMDALAALHKKGIVHRDIAPDNIMIPNQSLQQAKLIDLGVASDTIGTDKTILGEAFAGKYSYASPEQLGIGEKSVGPASDIYSLGLVLLKASGVNPPGANGTPAGAISARSADLDLSQSGLEPELQNYLEGFLKLDPQQRVSSDGTPLEVTGVGGETYRRSPKQSKQKPSTGLYVVLGVLVACLAVGGLYLAGVFDGPTTAVTEAERAERLLREADPLENIAELINLGGSENLSVALGSLMKFESDPANDQSHRGRAATLLAEMYDPETYDAARSPMPSANPSAALRFYKKAVAHGADVGAQVARLEAMQ